MVETKEGEMNKRIELTDEAVDQVTEYQKRNGLKSFSSAIQNIIDNMVSKDDQFILISDAIVKMNEKIDILAMHIAPKSAGEVKDFPFS